MGTKNMNDFIKKYKFDEVITRPTIQCGELTDNKCKSSLNSTSNNELVQLLSYNFKEIESNKQ